VVENHKAAKCKQMAAKRNGKGTLAFFEESPRNVGGMAFSKPTRRSLVFSASSSSGPLRHFRWDSAPHVLLRDRDRIFGSDFTKQVKELGIQEVLGAP